MKSKQEQLTVPASKLDMSKFKLSSGIPLPPQNPDTIRSMAISAAWAHGLLETPPYVAGTKCPILPSFIPRSHVDGLIHTDSSPSTFHGVSPDNNQQLSQCPYHHSQ